MDKSRINIIVDAELKKQAKMKAIIENTTLTSKIIVWIKEWLKKQ